MQTHTDPSSPCVQQLTGPAGRDSPGQELERAGVGVMQCGNWTWETRKHGVSEWERGQRIYSLVTQEEPRCSPPSRTSNCLALQAHWLKIFTSVTIQKGMWSLPQPKFHLHNLCLKGLSHTSNPTLCVEQTSQSSPPHPTLPRRKPRMFWTPIETVLLIFTETFFFFS